MFKLNKWARAIAPTCVLAAASLAPIAASAGVVQLGFILDRSGSIGSGNWSTIVNGLSTAVNTLIPTGSLYEISVVTFSSSATININSFLVTDAASRTALAGQIALLPYSGGGTNFASAFTAMNTALFDVANPDVMSTYLNFATDGVSSTSGVTERNTLIANGVDNISIEGIGGGVDANFLQGSICYPQPCDTTTPYNFPTQGFYIGVADAAGYAAAIGNKIRVVTQIPEPSSLALVGLALAAFGVSRRRRVASPA